MQYKDMQARVPEISRCFPTAEYDAALVEEALAIARKIVNREPDALGMIWVPTKDRRPSWGAWDGRIDFRTEMPTRCGVEVTLPIPHAGTKVSVMIRHNAQGSVPGTSGDPMGLSREIVCYNRPYNWREKELYSWAEGADEFVTEGPLPVDGYVRYYSDNPPGTETLVWFPNREDAVGSITDEDAREALRDCDGMSDQTPEGSIGRLVWGVIAIVDLPRYARLANLLVSRNAQPFCCVCSKSLGQGQGQILGSQFITEEYRGRTWNGDHYCCDEHRTQALDFGNTAARMDRLYPTGT